MPSVEDFIVDFGKEEQGGGSRPRYKEGTYLSQILGGKTGISANKGSPYLEVVFKFKEGPHKGKRLAERLYNTPKSIRRFRILLNACGITKLPKKLNMVKVIKAIKGKELYVKVEDEPAQDGYDARSRAAFEGFIKVEDYNPDEEDEDLEDEDEDEDLEDEEDEDLEDEEDEDLEDEDEDEDEDLEEDEDEEEEEEPPKRKTKSKTKAKATATKKSPAKKRATRKHKAKDEEDLDDLDLDEL